MTVSLSLFLSVALSVDFSCLRTRLTTPTDLLSRIFFHCLSCCTNRETERFNDKRKVQGEGEGQAREIHPLPLSITVGGAVHFRAVTLCPVPWSVLQHVCCNSDIKGDSLALEVLQLLSLSLSLSFQ